MHDAVQDIDAIIADVLQRAAAGDAGRAATTVFGEAHSTLRQTVIGMTAGADLHDHESPGEATLHVLRGDVELRSGAGSRRIGHGLLTAIPAERHSLHAVTDAVVLLTVAKTP